MSEPLTDAERLARYDRMRADLLAEKSRIADKMDLLRLQGRQKSASFRQLMGDKLTVQAMLSRLASYGL
ncbi:MAG: hypothetical protein LKJ80_03765 [Oscillibacter sp.]|jgi:hypothetical protein|nr:hypothetical protein [Oscillibacter sp.]